MLDLLHSIYYVAAGIFVLVTFFCLVFSYSSVYEGERIWHLKEIWRKTKLMPIRSCLVLSNFLHWFAVTAGYVFPVDLTWAFLARSITLRFPVMLASLAILFCLVHIQTGDWDIYHGERKKGSNIV